MASRAPLAALALVVGVAAGCGGRERAAPPPQPTLPHAVASRLAARADGVRSLLERGDGCGAARAATTLRRDAIAAINAHRVPRRLQETLLGAVSDLAARIDCVPPPPPPPPPEDEHGKPKKHHGPKKHGHRGEDGD